MNIDIPYYFARFVRRLHYFLLVVFAFMAASISAALLLPTEYVSSAKLLVESARISDDLAESTVQIDAGTQLQIIQERLLTRANLLAIARKFDAVSDHETMSADEIVRTMKEQTSIRQSGGRNSARFLNVSFTTGDPNVAADVANEYVRIVLEENVEYRNRLAGDTLVFFEQEVDQLARELLDKSQEVLEFKQKNSDALPDTLNFRMSRQSQIQERLTASQSELVSLADQRRRMVRFFEATGSTGQEAELSSEARELQSLRSALDEALLVYSEQSPRVQMLRNRVDRLERVVAEQMPAGVDGEISRKSLFQLQLDEIDDQISKVEFRIDELDRQIVELQQSIEATPERAIALDILERDYARIERGLERANGNLAAAKTGERIEALAKGERITVLEQAVAPASPSKPNRKLIAAGGTAAGIAFGFGLVLLLELLNRSIKRPADLTASLGIAPLATLPLIRTKQDMFVRRVIITTALIVAVVGVPAMLYGIHTLYMPLDLIASKVVQRLGV
ncbi:MAG: lipopolysaccharide biosynthesis protein [Pseudomonadota bacterium]